MIDKELTWKQKLVMRILLLVARMVVDDKWADELKRLSTHIGCAQSPPHQREKEPKMPDSEAFVSMPLRECTACAWAGVILSNSPPQSGMYYLEFEPVDGPDRCAFCPECGQPLKVRNSGCVTPGNFIKAIFGVFESLFIRAILIWVVAAALVVGLGYWVAHC